MRHRLFITVLALSLLATVMLAGRRSFILDASGQTPPLQVPSPPPAQTYPIRPEKVPVNNSNVQLAPLGDSGNSNNNNRAPSRPTGRVGPPSAYVARGFFRVTLNGFKVNHESDDDILEGDGRGDEIYVTTNIWTLHPDGTYLAAHESRTKVMGDPNNHPERVAAGSGHPGPTSLNVMTGGLHTGDVFPRTPTNEPWRRTREPLTDRPPVVLWNGYLNQGGDMMVIAPIIWEWDSDDLSDSQRSVASGLPRWFDHIKTSLLPNITNWRLGNRVNFGPYPISLSGKAGTRPIGYREAGTSPPPSASDVSYDYLGIVGLYLTYDSAVQAADKVELGMRGLYQLRYVDASDNGDYTLYVQVERLDAH